MKNLLLFTTLILLPFIGSAQKIIKGEYFFDTDPGIGLGTNITVAIPADSVELNFTASVSPLSIGLHNLYVRMLNDSGVWSIAENRLLNIYKATANSAIVASEYFFDTDPGIGNGSSVSVGTIGDSVEFSSLISVNSLSAGLHNLYFRTKNLDGVWSLAENRLVNIYKANANNNIVSAEYFFDTDPGVGLGIALATGTAADSVDFASVIAPGSISLGLHNLYIRTKNADGVWSLSENRLINIFKNVNSQIVWSEYFFTTDPGVGNGTGSAVPVPGDSVEFITNAPTAGLGFGIGTHSIFMRTKNADGIWSLAEERTFSVCDTIGVVTAITGDTMIAACAHQLGITYTIDTVLNADFYVWTLPPGATIVSGDSTTSITVNYSAYSSSGFVTVAGGYANCVGTPTSLHINFKPIPVAEICYATVDSLTQKTIISWQRPSENYVSAFLIFREIAGIFTAIDTVPNIAPGTFLDTGSAPGLRTEKYKIAVLDSCGNSGDTSSIFEHRTIYLYGYVGAGSITKLYWTDYIGNPDTNRYYNVMRDTSGFGAFTLLASNLPKTTLNYTDVTSGSFGNCRYLIDMFSDISCDPMARILLNKSTSRSNIKNKNALLDSLTFFTGVLAPKKMISDLKIYPNPAKDIVNISIRDVSKKYEVSIFDALGKEVLKSASSNYKNESLVQLPLKGIARGLYFVKIKTPEKEYVSKLNVE
jgi:Secretion system C-terminal sorting domain/PKD-like domain